MARCICSSIQAISLMLMQGLDHFLEEIKADPVERARRERVY